MLNRKTLEAFPFIGNNRKLSVINMIIYIGLDNIVIEREIESIKCEVCVMLIFTDGMILYLESSRTSVRKLFQKFSKYLGT